MTNELKETLRYASHKTVGELIDELSKYKRDTPIVGTQYTAFISDAGSDLGGDDEVGIKSVTDLESRIVIEMNQF